METRSEPSGFPHEALLVYRRCLDFQIATAARSQLWDERHAVVDELRRAAESIALNLALAAGRESKRNRLCSLDYSLGSTAECAACFDILKIKLLCPESEVSKVKRDLWEIICMLHGLRRAWLHSQMLKDEPSRLEGGSARFFAHETLHAYKSALKVIKWFHACGSQMQLSLTVWRELDKASTATVLHIAEGNARFSRPDQARFFTLAFQALTRFEATISNLGISETIPRSTAEKARPILRESARLIKGLLRFASSAASSHY